MNQLRTSSFKSTRYVVCFVLLFAVAIPWWWQFAPETGNQLVLGAPLWFVTSIVGSLVISIVTAVLLVVAWNSVDSEEDDHRG